MTLFFACSASQWHVNPVQLMQKEKSGLLIILIGQQRSMILFDLNIYVALAF